MPLPPTGNDAAPPSCPGKPASSPWRSTCDLTVTVGAVVVILAVVIYFSVAVAAMRRTQDHLRARMDVMEVRGEAEHRAAEADRRLIRAKQAELVEALRALAR